MQAYNPKDALIAIFETVTLANQFVEERKPWVTARNIFASAPLAQPAQLASVLSEKEKLAETMIVLAEVLARAGSALLAFLPETAPKILTRLGCDAARLSTTDSMTRLVLTGVPIEKGAPLFPRLEDE